ncbi:putative vomeronasal receptor-like protein 4 [Apodemus sylvaticus]|uniref:putative vomeronasal receptor-like protein 4 n=1 Tax=Apodemus sylvaticus TaxID=10129 RepID=UPI002244A017|nr:putative vomeronasal receptor-like protein 4 [Apodemus sylvaticus]
MSSIKNVLYFQSALGVLANMFLLFFYIFIFLGHRPKPMDLISCQLNFVHIMMLLTAGDIWIADLFESLNIENDFKCKATFYINRVMRGLSICITCHLSMVQAVTISPTNSMLAKFKHTLKKYIIYVFFYFWLFNLSFSSNQIFSAGAYINVSVTNQIKVSKYCSHFPMNNIRDLILLVTTLRDVFLVGVMLTTSTYMVIILFRHQRQCKHLHSTRHLRASPEKRATKTILLLVVFFVFMYWVDFFISSTSILLGRYDPVILTVQKFVMNAYPTITPLVQISSDHRICQQVFLKGTIFFFF